MDRLHIEVPKLNMRTMSEGSSPGVLPMISAGLMTTNNTMPHNTFSPDFTGLACHPCFNRRIFAPNGFRPNPRDLLDKTGGVSGGELFSGGQMMKCMEWGATQLEMDRYAQRYRLQANFTKSLNCSVSPESTQPEDLTTTGSANMDRSDDEDEADDEDENVDMADDDDDEEDASEQSKSVGHLKFSIASILSGPKHKPKHTTKKLNINGGDASNQCVTVSVNHANDVMTDPEESCLEKDSSSDDKGLDGLLADSDRFSWLQCTRYKPPKLPRSKKKDGAKKRKLGRNPRVPFTQHQVTVLEQKFRQTHYLSSVDVAELSAALNLTETRVKIWFQNRRARERRDRENIQLLQSGSTSTVTGSAPKPNKVGADRLSPDIVSATHRSPRDLGQDMSPVSSGLYPHRLHLPTGGVSHMGLGALGGLGSPSLPPGAPWHSPLLPKPSVLAQFTGSHRASAFTPVTYFSYS